MYAIMAGNTEADAYKLLSLASDPESTKLRLDELIGEINNFRQISQQNADLLAQAQKERFAIAEEQRKLEENKAGFELTTRYAKEDLERDKAKVESERQDAYSLSQVNQSKAMELLAKESILEKKESDLSYREQQIKGREDAVSKREIDVANLQKEYEDKISKLKQLL